MRDRLTAPALLLCFAWTLAEGAGAQSCGNLYDFNGLTGSDVPPYSALDAQDGWTAESYNTGIACGVAATLGQDGTQALRFEQVGPNVGCDASRLNDGAWSLPSFGGAETSAFFQADFSVSYWGAYLALGYDADGNGKIRGSEAGERGPLLGVDSQSNHGISIIAADGTANVVPLTTIPGASGGTWLRLRLVMDFTANGGSGSGSVDYVNLSAGGTEWAPVAGLQGIDLGLTPGSGNAADPANWSAVWLHFEGATNQLDNLQVGLQACDVGVAYCFGDGSGSSCPCGNPGANGAGCANSSGVGATLTTAGTNRIANDDLVFSADHLLAGQPALLFDGINQVNGGQGILFGGGLRCAGVGVQRVGVRVPDVAGHALWGPGLAGVGGYAAGDTRNFQIWYRDPAGSPCGSGFNLSNGVSVSFIP